MANNFNDVLRINNTQFTQLMDNSAANNMTLYIGWATPGTATSAGQWRIQKLTYDGNGMVDGIVNRMKDESDERLTVVATGGLAPLICKVSNTINHVEEFLTLQGLMAIFKMNQ